MLRHLSIRNFAIIDEQSISFGPGLNVISGETGAGKSIVLDALSILLGARASTQLIRAGADALEVEALIDLSALAPQIQNELPEIARGEELLLSRSLNRSGKGKVLINGRLGTVALIQEICDRLISICGQNQHVRLLNPAFHRQLIDGFAGHEELLSRYTAIYQQYDLLHRGLLTREAESRSNQERLVLLAALLAELRPFAPVPGERRELENQIRRRSSVEQIVARSGVVADLLGSEVGLEAQFQALLPKISELEKLDNEFSVLLAKLQQARGLVAEFESGLNRYVGGLTLDEEELERLRSRLSELARLERKYRSTDQGLLELLEKSEKDYALYSEPDALGRLRAECEALRLQAVQLAQELTHSRSSAGQRLSKAVLQELSELAMVGAQLDVRLENMELSASGADRVELFLSPNKGEPLSPLREIASGGELSRITLVLKKLLRDTSGVNVLVFDEIDTGISGGVARAVGEKLQELARESQVICITHLAQVASLADTHLVVSKTSGERTVAQIHELDEEQKVEEIARMLAGYKVTAASRASARELLSSKVSGEKALD